MPRILQITATHLYADPAARFDGVDTGESLARVLAHMRAHADGAALVLLTGDLAMDGSEGAYVRLAAALGALDVPLLALPGNHDEPAALAAGAPALAATLPLCRELDGWRLLCLDTRVDGSVQGEVDPAQCDWLARTLAADRRPAAIFMHHPPLPIGSPWMDALGLLAPARFWAALGGHDTVRFVACGHVHQAGVHARDGVPVYTTPATCVQFRPGATRYTVDPVPPGYRVFDLDAEGRFATRVVRVPA
jgi:Icc protein